VTAAATAGGVRLAWEELGAGEPVLLIHGLGYDRRGWGPLPALLAADFRVVLFDNRGVGESDVPAGPYTTAQLAADAVAVLDAAGVERAHVVGTSLGGMIAQELALSSPERVERLVLACTTPGGERSFPMPERGQRLFLEFLQEPAEEGLRGLVENALADATVAGRPELVEEIYAYRLAHRPPLDGWQAQAGAAFGFDALDRVASLTMPVLLLHGTDDHVVDTRNSSLLAEAIPGARLELFEGTGHLFFWEEPERFAASVRRFLREGT
jgi:pimeloyl-ACP methyl ester carboxylesterase